MTESVRTFATHHPVLHSRLRMSHPIVPSNQTTRRRFLTAATAAACTVAGSISGSNSAAWAGDATSNRFTLGFAPHPGMFRRSAGEDLLDQVRFAADQGFTAFEYNGLPGETPEVQTKLGELLDDLGMQMGVFVGYANFDRPTFANPRDDDRKEILASIQQAVEIAARVGAKWFTVVPGSIDQQSPDQWSKYGGPRLAAGYQTANVIDMLRRCVDVIGDAAATMVLEPLNPHTNHGGTFLQRSDQAFAICRAVDSPRCKILFDIYHQQITEGNLIPNIDRCWDEIAYFQSGDNPGRKEPTTGEINYAAVFSHIHAKGYTGVIGMEHGNSQPGPEGEQAVIQAYRTVDPTG